MKKSVTNTTEATFRDPQGFLAESLVMGTEKAITNQEARGQRELAESSSLPSEGSDHPAWAKMGVIFGEKVEGDPLFRQATLPKGWKVKATDHSMWSKLVDEKGRERGSIGYKAAFYDRWALISPERRYIVRSQYEGDDGRRRVECFDSATSTVLFAADWEARPDYSAPRAEVDAYFAKSDANLKACADWLAEKFPEHNDPAAYWD